MKDILAKAALIKLVIFDVDGVLTDGSLFFATMVRNTRPSIRATATA